MKQRRADALRDALEAEIVTGEIPPGTRLDEVSLARRFGASRTPLREAFQQLAAAGLVALKPGRGAFVNQFDVGEMLELFETMAEMEAICSRLAARRMNKDEKASLEEAHQACSQAAKDGNPDKYYYENARFHELIYDGCHNRFLVEEIKTVRRRLQAYRRLQLRVPNRMLDSLAEHAQIVEAIKKNNGAKAEEATRAHVMVQGERFSDLIAQIRNQKKAS